MAKITDAQICFKKISNKPASSTWISDFMPTPNVAPSSLTIMLHLRSPKYYKRCISAIDMGYHLRARNHNAFHRHLGWPHCHRVHSHCEIQLCNCLSAVKKASTRPEYIDAFPLKLVTSARYNGLHTCHFKRRRKRRPSLQSGSGLPRG